MERRGLALKLARSAEAHKPSTRFQSGASSACQSEPGKLGASRPPASPSTYQWLRPTPSVPGRSFEASAMLA